MADAALSVGPAAVTVSPKIRDINSGAQFARDFANNPPTTPAGMASVLGDALGISGALSAGIGAVFPFALPVLPILSGIFDLFGGGGPSIGQITLDAIGKVSEQINAGFAAVGQQIDALAEKTAAEASRTIDTVLSGVDEISRKQSAAQVFESIAAQSILAESEAKKVAAFADYTNTVNAARAAFVDDVSGALKKAQAKADYEYAIIQAQVATIAGDVFKPIAAALEQAQADAAELLEIQRQLDEISDVIKSGQLAAIAKSLVKQYMGVK